MKGKYTFRWVCPLNVVEQDTAQRAKRRYMQQEKHREEEVEVLKQISKYGAQLGDRTPTRTDVGVLLSAFVCHQTSRASELQSSVIMTENGKVQ